jgi:hypothetical protein
MHACECVWTQAGHPGLSDYLADPLQHFRVAHELGIVPTVAVEGHVLDESDVDGMILSGNCRREGRVVKLSNYLTAGVRAEW